MRRSRQTEQKAASLDGVEPQPVEPQKTDLLDLRSTPGRTDVRSVVGHVLVYGLIFSTIFLELMDPLVPLQRLPSPEESEYLTGVLIGARPVEILFGFTPDQVGSQVAVSSAFGLGMCFLTQLLAKAGSLLRSA